MVTGAGEPIIAEGKYSLSIGGGQPAHGRSYCAGNVPRYGNEDSAGIGKGGNGIVYSKPSNLTPAKKGIQ
jgi:hypothetical protein